ncbi:MAG: hypothetical protein QGG84_02315 [Rhodospirillales bacterium]|nr:hypothetical protein [Rhodospirillales bacterium]
MSFLFVSPAPGGNGSRIIMSFNSLLTRAAISVVSSSSSASGEDDPGTGELAEIFTAGCGAGSGSLTQDLIVSDA